ncbi:MAG: hypothetical protein KGQ70_08980 [Alphaproteobacteria bacterium]|nr:hypothetical protein [Alphaproteobacteria bacterium]
MSKFNNAAKRTLNLAVGSTEILAATGTLLIGIPASVAMIFVAPLAGAILLPTAFILGGLLANDGSRRLARRIPAENLYSPSRPLPWQGGTAAPSGKKETDGRTAAPKKPAPAPAKSKIVPWYDEPAAPQPQPQPGPFNPAQPGSSNNPFPMYDGPKIS